MPVKTALPRLGLLFATLAGCASAESQGAQSTGGTPAYVNGTWTGGTIVGASPIVVVLQQTGNAVTGTLSGAGANLDGPIEGSVDSNSIRLRQRSGMLENPPLKASCEQISGNLGGTVVNLRRAAPTPSTERGWVAPRQAPRQSWWSCSRRETP